MNKSELLAKAKSILFNTPMVQATLDGRKTVTRRVVKPQPIFKTTRKFIFNDDECPKKWEDCDNIINTYRYQVGDILYVRETWCWCPCWDCGMDTVEGCCDETAHQFYNFKCNEWGCYGYKASWELNSPPFDRWHPSIHMPKEAARIFLRVTDVSVERLQDIVTGDYKTPLNINAEGLYAPCCRCTHVNGDCKDFIAQNNCRLLTEFKELWDSTIKKTDLDRYGWNANPFVWVIEFERLEVV